ncbi:MAG: hypothetical protein U0457_05150 [Candidatus Sericytochromatia bacterium]
MNLTQAGLSTSFALDAVNRQLSNNATTGVSYDPTSRSRVSAHETDKQAEDNATWYFEYRALLNSKLTTLITSLTSAYTTDLDAAMGASSTSTPAGNSWGTKTAMQGLTGQKLTPTSDAFIDPGAARTTFAYLNGFNTSTPGNPSTPVGTNSITVPNAPDWKGTSAGVVADIAASVTMSYNYQDPATAVAANSTISGTTSFLAGGSSTFILDKLKVNMDPYNFPPLGVAPFTNVNRFDNDKLQELDSFTRDVTGNDAARQTRNIGNNFEYTLYKFFEKPENLDLIRFGLFNDVYVVGTSSLPTGSQTQGSISLNWDSLDQKIRIKQERYACFFHS